jgi:CubicO group peptidase (beta-lactamase class C family)
MEARINSRIPSMERILAITGQPGVSIGVLHRGQVIFNQSLGYRDVSSQKKADGDTLYCMGSLTKGFVSVALNNLIYEKDFSWSDKVAKFVPGLAIQDDPTLVDRLNLTDLVSHRSGLNSLDQLIQGLDGRILVPKDKVVPLMRELPVQSDIRTAFSYTNVPFSVAGKIIEDQGKCGRWDDYLKAKITGPLGMDRTTVDWDTFVSDSNIAQPCTVLVDGSLRSLPQPSLSASTLHGCAGGIRSSVNDMLKWCQAIILATTGQDSAAALSSNVSPCFESAVVIDPSSTAAGSYCLGWVKQATPATLGMISPNRRFFSPELGKTSPSKLVYSHNGDVRGYQASLCIFPHDEVAIVAFTNGTGMSDCTDWIIQDIAQEMFRFEPKIDYVDLAKQAAQLCASRYNDNFVVPLQEHQVKDTKKPPQKEFIGHYSRSKNEDAALNLVITEGQDQGLRLVINGQVEQAYHLHHYHFDTWCLLPKGSEEAITRGYFNMFETWEEYLVAFGRRSDGTVAWMDWKLGSVTVRFDRSL